MSIRSCFVLLILYYAGACFSNTTVMILGDSLSAGYGLQTNQSWVYLLREKLQEAKIDANVVNASVSGASTADGLNALPKLLNKYNPNIVVVALGSNDGLRGDPILLMQNNLKNIILKSQDANCKVLLIGFQIPPNYGASYAKSFAEVFPELSKEYSLPLVPFMLAGFATDSKLFQADRLHPTAAAQPLILNNIWPYLEPMLLKR